MLVTSRSLLAWTSLFAVSVLVAWNYDTRAYHWAVDFAVRTDAGRATSLFQAVGYLPTWILLAAAFASADRARLVRPVPRVQSGGAWMWRAKLLLVPGLLAGVASVGFKLLIRRERPNAHDGEIWFRPFSEKLLSSSSLGLPSGETSVAFAGVFMLYRMFPSAWPIWFLLGYGCGFSRMLVGEHFLSDVVAGAFLGCACASLVWRMTRTRDEAEPPEERAPRVGLVRGTAWLALLAGVVLLLSHWTAWQPATADELPGIYTSRRLSGPRLSYYFEPDGRYTSTALHESDPPRLEHSAGTWKFEDGLLRIDDADAVRLEAHSRLLRLSGDAESLVLYREEQWNPESWVGRGAQDAGTP